MDGWASSPDTQTALTEKRGLTPFLLRHFEDRI